MAGPAVRIWEVVGGVDKGGIVVRDGRDVGSAQASSRLSTGALVREKERVGERLCFKRLTGTGPDTGWVSVRLGDKELVKLSDQRPPAVGWRLYAVSDLHIDYKENQAWVESLPLTGHESDAVILAGDLSHNAEKVRWTISEFRKRFDHVFYCVGNHELWVKRKDAASDGTKMFSDSLDKFEHLMAMARELGAYVDPVKLGEGANALWIVPLQSWYESEFGQPGEELKKQAEKMLTDFHQVVWPGNVGSTPDDAARYFDDMNNALPDSGFDAPVVTFSHFLPRLELMPAQLPPSHKLLRAGVGTKALEERLRSIDSKLHVFGHSHINWYTHWNGVHYVQNAIRYPGERRGFKSRVDVSFDGIEDPLQPFMLWKSDDPENFCLQPERCGRGCSRALALSMYIENKDSKTAAATWEPSEDPPGADNEKEGQTADLETR